MNTVYIDMRYEIQEQKEVPVWYTGIYPPISSTAYKTSHTGNKHKHHNTFKAKLYYTPRRGLGREAV
jgi:hypothetical protein